MKDIGETIYNIRRIDTLGDMDTPIHRINGAIKIIVTLMYIIRILSLKSFTFLDMLVILSYPVILFLLGNIPFKFILTKVIIVLPIALGISIVNLMINFSYYQIIFSLIIIVRFSLTLIGALLLIVTTGMENLAVGFRKLKIPKIIVSEIVLLYRYIILMLEEALSIKSAYELRTLDKKSMTMGDWGQIMGQMLLKSIDRAENIYSAMKLRGFQGDYISDSSDKLKARDYIYLIVWVLVLFLV